MGKLQILSFLGATVAHVLVSQINAAHLRTQTKWVKEFVFTVNVTIDVGNDQIASGIVDLREEETTEQRRKLATARRDLAFPVLARMEEFKSERTIWSPPADNGRSTLSKAHYLVLPTWYEGEDPFPHDMVGIRSVMTEVSQYYTDMSWGLHSLTWELLDPIILEGVTKDNAALSPAKNRALKHIQDTLGLQRITDFTGVILLHAPAGSGPMRWGDGFAHVNGGNYSMLHGSPLNLT